MIFIDAPSDGGYVLGMETSPTTHSTKHMQARMSQRGIPAALVNLVREFGRDDQDRLVLNRRDLRGLLSEVRGLERVVLKALDKGGVVVVEADGSLITAYNADSFDRRRAHVR
jgi:hypothetical protein